MRILMFRAWNALSHAATFSTIKKTGVGGTELQLLQHAGALRDLGHEVSVLGATRDNTTEEGIFFQGTSGKPRSLELLKNNYSDTHVVFANVTEDLPALRAALPQACIVEVCQNGPNFSVDKYIDIYAYVGFGQFAYYCTKFKKYRDKFMLLPSVPLVHSLYSGIQKVDGKNQIIWVGSLNKQGFRRWAKAMQRVMMRDRTIKWVICSPSYDQLPGTNTPAACTGITLPYERIEFKNLSLSDLAVEIKSSKIILASLGGEDGPVSYLDGHALGVPVLCGDDIYGKYYNPEGSGLRCTTVQECEQAIEFLLKNPGAAKTMGEMGKKWLVNNMTEQHQISYLEQIISYVALKRQYHFPVKSSIQSDRKFSLTFWLERVSIKLSKIFNMQKGLSEI